MSTSKRKILTDPTALRKRLLYIIERSPGVTMHDLFQQIGMDKARLRRHIAALPVVGLAEYTGSRGWQHHYYRWRWWCDCGAPAAYQVHFAVPGQKADELQLCGQCATLFLNEMPTATISAIVYGQ